MEKRLNPIGSKIEREIKITTTKSKKKKKTKDIFSRPRCHAIGIHIAQ